MGCCATRGLEPFKVTADRRGVNLGAVPSTDLVDLVFVRSACLGAGNEPF